MSKRQHSWKAIPKGRGVRMGMKRCPHCGAVRWLTFAIGAGESPVYLYRLSAVDWSELRPRCFASTAAERRSGTRTFPVAGSGARS